MKLFDIIPSYYINSFYKANNHMSDKQCLKLALEIFLQNQSKIDISLDKDEVEKIYQSTCLDGLQVYFYKPLDTPFSVERFVVSISFKGSLVFENANNLAEKKLYFYNWNNYFNQAKVFQRLCNDRFRAYQEAKEFQLQEAF